jgi:hypothetical protein
MRTFLCTISFLLCLVCSPALALMQVEVSATTSDTVGQRLVFALKEGIRRSSSLALSFDQSKPRIQVNVVTLDQSTSTPGNSTVYAVVILWNNPAQLFPFYLTQYVGHCGSSRVVECADGLVAGVSEQSDSLLKLFPTLSK